MLGEVVISAGRYEQNINEVAVSMQTINNKQLTQNSSADAQDMVERISGVNTLKGQVNIRGNAGFSYGAGSRVLVLVDDMPLLAADAGDVKWGYLPTENVAQVEVIKGASSALFGSSAMGGIIHFRTAYPSTKPITKINSFVNMYTPARAPVRQPWSAGRNPLVSNLNFLHSRQIGNFDIVVGGNATADQGYRIGEYSRRVRLNANTRYRFKKEGLFAGININAMRDSSGVFLFWKNDTLALQPGANTASRQLSKRINIDPYITYAPNAKQKHSLRNRIFFTDALSDKGFSTTATVYYNEYQFQQRFAFKFAEQTVLTAGAVSTQNRIVSDSLYGKHSSGNQAVYAQFDQKIKRLNYNIGGRFERFVINTDAPIYFPIFRAGINYQLAEATFVRASGGQGFRTPSVAERYSTASAGGLSVFPNPRLGSEQGISAEVGARQGLALGKNLRGVIDVAAFATRYKNMVEFIPTIIGGQGFGFQAQNIGNTQIIGIETNLLAEGNFGDFKPSFNIGYTYINPTERNDAAKILKYRYKHLLRSDIDLVYKRLTIGTNILYNSYMERIDDIFVNFVPGVGTFRNAYKDQGNLLLTFRANYACKNGIKIGAVCRNATNILYMPVPGNLGEPRSIGIQLGYEF
jgi:iron complex outermembrane receptor protein